MNKKRRAWISTALVMLMLVALACTCGPDSSQNTVATAAAFQHVQDTVNTAAANSLTAAAIATSTPTPGATATESELTIEAEITDTPKASDGGGSQTRQWASSATATSEWSDDSGAAREAAGPPDSAECIDQHSAWATSGRNDVADLTLDYSTPVVPTQINIYQTWHPDGVSQVAVIDANGVSHTVYTATPRQLPEGSTPCPYLLTIDINNITVPIARIVVTVDQTNHSSWNEIDAVELVGTS